MTVTSSLRIKLTTSVLGKLGSTNCSAARAGAQAAAARLSERLVAAQEQMVCATVDGCQQPSPGRAQTAQALEVCAGCRLLILYVEREGHMLYTS